ncbi:Dyp-type peroxidase [Streptomyces sp. NPDC089799]|uniref:Dyp-type peroxidase n=1 Tax=Streptomyces sp. NPDC089799 TaxID=3155066 RepID=UPI003449564D
MNAFSDNRLVVTRRALLAAVPAAAVSTGCRPDAGSGVRGRPVEGAEAAEAAEGAEAADGVEGLASTAEAAHQEGVDRPEQPQTHVVVSVYDLADPDGAGRAGTGRMLKALGETVLKVTEAGSGRGSADGLTVTVGLGPGPLAALDRRLPGAAELPAFAREERTSRTWGGDLLVQVCANGAAAAAGADADLAGLLEGRGAAARRWSQTGFRPPGTGPVRNLLGFQDGIEIPRGRAELERDVWLSGPDPVAGGTIAVVRRLRIDVPEFLAQPVHRQEEAIGRRKADGAPLGGGAPLGRLDLSAKTPQGRYLVPAMAHARRANPNATGSGKMLRRGYAYDNGPGDRGLLFIGFQRELRTFTATQRRLDEGDDLMAFVTATASAGFLVLPGFDADRPLGATLFPVEVGPRGGARSRG